MDDIRDNVIALLEPLFVSFGFDLVDASVSVWRNNSTVQILADKPQGGITVNECAYLSRQIDAILEKENLFQGSYTLEVSSPGIDRPLTNEKDFMRARGKRLVFSLKEPCGGVLERAGVVLRVDNNCVYVKDKEKEECISIQLINQAKYVF